MYITNKYHSVKLPYEPELLAWLQEQYPHSQYKAVHHEMA
jgi:hypothetical protein